MIYKDYVVKFVVFYEFLDEFFKIWYIFIKIRGNFFKFVYYFIVWCIVRYKFFYNDIFIWCLDLGYFKNKFIKRLNKCVL